MDVCDMENKFLRGMIHGVVAYYVVLLNMMYASVIVNHFQGSCVCDEIVYGDYIVYGFIIYIVM